MGSKAKKRRRQSEYWRSDTTSDSYFSVLNPKHFCGEIIIEKDPLKAIETACLAHHTVSTPTEIVFPIFADGSQRGDVGSYAVAFDRYAPGTVDHACEVTAGWPVIDHSNNGCEALAIKQAIKVAILELITLEKRLPSETRAMVEVQVFSDAMFVLEHLSGYRDTMSNDSYHILSIDRLSQEFRRRFAGSNSPLNAKLQLLWVPGHVEEVTLHQKADEVARKVRETQMLLLTVAGEERPCDHSDPVFQQLSQELPETPHQTKLHVAEEDIDDQDRHHHPSIDVENTRGQDDKCEPRNDEEEFAEDGLLHQGQPECSNAYEMPFDDDYLVSRAHDEDQDISFEQWVIRCQDIQVWSQLKEEFEECYQQWYALYLQQLRQGEVKEEMV